MNITKIILSTAIINDGVSAEDRIVEYKENFDIIKNLGYEFIIVETVLGKSDFLESNSKNVFYTNVNGVYKNRGTNYVNAFKKFINNSDFDDEDIIIHVTGRYPFIDDSFFKKCKSLEKDKVGCFKKDDYGQFHLFLYALRYREIKNLLNSIDIDNMESEMKSLEGIFPKKLPYDKLVFVDKLGIIGKQSTGKSLPDYGKNIF